jgi:glycosyltransferase involved in cell wall biosynthesis
MKHVLDVSTLNTYSSGAKQRFLNLYSELIKNNKKKNFEIIYTTFDQVKIFFRFSNVSFKKNPINQDSPLKKIISIFNIFFYIKNSLKKVHSVEYFTLPFIKINNCRTIFTIHDLRRIYFAKSFFKKILLKLFFKFFIHQAEKIIVVSKSIENEIKRYFGNLNISVIYNTINLKDYKNIKLKDTLLIKKKYNLKKKFILSVGHLENRKNYLRLIKSIDILYKNNFDINLIIIGQKADETKKIKKLIKKLKLSSKIKVLSNLNDYEVKCFYKLASLFVFPSIYEGFGIPILESMASNKPMVLSNTEIFREITENKYIYFDQFDPHSIANKIKFVLENKKIQKDMISYGKKRVNYFSLNNQKQNLIKLYNYL